MVKALDIVGQRFGRLVAVERGPNKNPRVTQWLCVCDCGKETLAQTQLLVSGRKSSCGCLDLESRQQKARVMAKANVKHGFMAGRKAGTPREDQYLYHAWVNMLARCNNREHRAFPKYGGRGIGVCGRWFELEYFVADMGPRPARGYSLDRVNNDGHYEPGNCRWATSSEQNNNRRSCSLRKQNTDHGIQAG